MRILLIDKEEHHKMGGITVFTSRLCSYLQRRHHEVYILRFSNKKIRQKNIYSLPYYLAESRTFIVLPSEKTLSLIKYYLTKIHPDIVYADIGLSPLDFFLPSLCHSLSIPITGVWHADFNYSSGAHQLLAKSLFLTYVSFCKQLDTLHVFTDKLATFYIQHGVKKQNIIVIPNGVDSKLYSPGPSDFARKHNVKFGILFVGRLTLQKNPSALLDAFVHISKSHNAKLVLVGHGDQEETLRQEYHHKNILFTGLVKDEKKKIDIIRSCKVFVLPSRFEGMPLALLEAMSTGLACIASDAGSNSEVLQQAGLIIPVSQIQNQLPFTLEMLLKHPEIIKLLGSKARKQVCNYYSQDLIFQKLTDSFTNTIRKFKAQPSTTEDVLFDLRIGKKVKTILDKLKILSDDFWG